MKSKSEFTLHDEDFKEMKEMRVCGFVVHVFGVDAREFRGRFFRHPL